jgi:prefoldin beta subunit
MEMDQETQQKIQELQGMEQNLNNLVMQKQAFQMELTETENALSEISKSKDDVFKLVGNIMIKADKKKTEDDLTKKKDLLSLRLKSIDSEEKSLTDNAEALKKEVMAKIQG